MMSAAMCQGIPLAVPHFLPEFVRWFHRVIYLYGTGWESAARHAMLFGDGDVGLRWYV